MGSPSPAILDHPAANHLTPPRWLQAQPNLPAQRLPLVWRELDGPHLADQVLQRRNGGLTGSKAKIAEWQAEERQWMAAVGVAADPTV